LFQKYQLDKECTKRAASKYGQQVASLKYQLRQADADAKQIKQAHEIKKQGHQQQQSQHQDQQQRMREEMERQNQQQIQLQDQMEQLQQEKVGFLEKERRHAELVAQLQQIHDDEKQTN
jgi:hypothetical protein